MISILSFDTVNSALGNVYRGLNYGSPLYPVVDYAFNKLRFGDGGTSVDSNGFSGLVGNTNSGVTTIVNKGSSPPADVSGVLEDFGIPITPNSSVFSGSGSTSSPLVYFDAPYAEKYGMSAETAYQEALANSAYQRKVADLKKAGLNPVLGIQGSGSASFGGDLASSGSVTSGKSGSDANSKYIPYVIDALVSIGATLISKNSAVGSAAGNAAAGLYNIFKK